MSVAEHVTAKLASLLPFTRVTPASLYAALPGMDQPSIRAALYREALGSPVNRREPPARIHAIRLVVNLPTGERDALWFSLAGLPRQAVYLDVAGEAAIAGIQGRLKLKYGTATIDYWGSAAQRRSVDIVNRHVPSASASGCRVCVELGVSGSVASRCHLVSRRTLFWRALDDVEKQHGSVFSDNATHALVKRLEEDPLHSHPQFVVALCREHNSLVLDVLEGEIAPPVPSETDAQGLLFWAGSARGDRR